MIRISLNRKYIPYFILVLFLLLAACSNSADDTTDRKKPDLPGTPTDGGEYTLTAKVVFTWTEPPEPQKILSYDIQIGSKPNLSDIFDGNAGKNNSFEFVGDEQQTLYARVRARKINAIIGDWTPYSDGITVDTIPPSMSCLEPADQSVDLQGNITIKLGFSEMVRPQSLAGALVMNGVNIDNYQVNADGQSLTFESAMELGTEYVLTVSDKVQDIAGHGLMQPAGCTYSTKNIKVEPAFSAAKNWNDYVRADDNNVQCTGSESKLNHHNPFPCLHGGENLKIVLPGVDNCANITAFDDLRAFNWSCGIETNNAVIATSHLKHDKSLADLIDFDSATWKTNFVSVENNGTTLFVTKPSTWWNNPVLLANTGGTLVNGDGDALGTVYLVTETGANNFVIGNDKVSLLVKPGLTVQWVDGAATISMILADTKKFLWLEGAFNGGYKQRAVTFLDTRFSQLRRLSMTNSADFAIMLDSTSTHNSLKDIQAANSVRGGFQIYSSFNRIVNVSNYNNSDTGLQSGGQSTYNIYQNITSTANTGTGLKINGENNIYSNVTVANNNSRADTIIDLGGIRSTGSNQLHFNMTVSNNGRTGLMMHGQDSKYMDLQIFASPTAIESYSLPNRITGFLGIGNVTTGCFVEDDSGQNTAFFDDRGTPPVAAVHSGDCIANPLYSDYGMLGGVRDMFAGKIQGPIAYPSDINTFSWLPNPYQTLGIDGTTYFDAAIRGRYGCNQSLATTLETCESPNGLQAGNQWRGNGAIWDWSVVAPAAPANPVQLNLPGGGTAINVYEHLWKDGSKSVFLKHAVEILLDQAGNENGLCESGERCLYTPWMAADMGQGKLIKTATFSNGIISDVTLYLLESVELLLKR